MFDNHIHSSFSGDSEMNAEIACEKAIRLGLDGIAFTDHLDLDYPDYDEKFLIDFDKYSNVMDQLRLRYREKLKILKGIEVGYQPHVMENTNQVLTSYDFDFVILSVHIIDRQDPYTKEYFQGKSKAAAFTRYLELIFHSVSDFDNFDVVGHIGYIRRYCDYDDKSLRHSDYPDLLDAILQKIIFKGKGLEINTSGYKGILFTPIPDYDILIRYKELGGEIITIGSDAHSPEHIGMEFGRVRERLTKIGFRYLAHFEGRKPVFELL